MMWIGLATSPGNEVIGSGCQVNALRDEPLGEGLISGEAMRDAGQFGVEGATVRKCTLAYFPQCRGSTFRSKLTSREGRLERRGSVPGRMEIAAVRRDVATKER